jgi:hypothetical protein
MHFDAKRLSILAGISPDRAMLSEGADTEEKGSWKKGGKSKTDKGTHDRGERADDEAGKELDEADHDYSGHGMRTGDEPDTDMDHADFEESVHADEPGWGQEKWDSGLEEDEDNVYEIDEGMLRRELKNIRSERQKALAETKVRNVIRHEINHIFKQLSNSDLNLGASWVYGDNMPTSSKAGQLWVGGPSIGFKK